MCDNDRNCGCKIVVTRTYRELKQRNIPDISAFDTATVIFRMHHPEATMLEARDMVAAWLDRNA